MNFKGVCVAALAAVTALAISAGGGLAKGPPYKVYLSLSYTGNDWQSEAENMIRALAASDRMKDKVKLEVEVSGPNAQKQSQQINAMVQAGADAIIMYGSSETLLNGAIKNACDKGVVVVAYDSFVSEPCAYNITTDATAFGRTVAEWLVKAMHEKGNVVMITGVPGFSTDTARNNAAKAVFEKYPDIKVIASVPAMWSEFVLALGAFEGPRDEIVGRHQRPLDSGRLRHGQYNGGRGRDPRRQEAAVRGGGHEWPSPADAAFGNPGRGRQRRLSTNGLSEHFGDVRAVRRTALAAIRDRCPRRETAPASHHRSKFRR